MEAIKEVVTNFLTSSLVTKILLFISVFLAPVWELYILLMFLVCLDYLIDLGVWFLRHRQVVKAWEVTKPFVVKVIMYSVLVITVNAVQLHLVKEAFELFKMVMAIPIIAELLGIIGTVERYTGVALVEKVKEMLKGWVDSKK